MTAICPDCNESRTVKWKPKKGVVCLSCRKERTTTPTGERTKYTRVCKCGDVATVGYKPKGTEMCRQCRGELQAKEMCGKNVKKDEDKKRYWYFCLNCPSVRSLVDTRKTKYCGACSKKLARKKQPYIYFDFKEMKMKVPKRYFAYCDGCHEVREVSQSVFSQYGYNSNCNKHRKRTATYKKSDKQVKKQARELAKPKQVSKHAIEKEIEANRRHREAQEQIASIPMAKLTEEEMMAIWLSRHNVTVIADTVQASDLGVGMKTGFCRAD